MRDGILEKRYIFLKEVSEEKQIEIIEKSQAKNSDPREPSADFADDLRATIDGEMNDPKEEEKIAVLYYAAGNTHLDYSKGVDGIIVFEDTDSSGKKEKLEFI